MLIQGWKLPQRKRKNFPPKGCQRRKAAFNGWINRENPAPLPVLTTIWKSVVREEPGSITFQSGFAWFVYQTNARAIFATIYHRRELSSILMCLSPPFPRDHKLTGKLLLLFLFFSFVWGRNSWLSFIMVALGGIWGFISGNWPHYKWRWKKYSNVIWKKNVKFAW